MQRQQHNAIFDLNTFAVVGFSYRQTPLSKRSALAIGSELVAPFYATMRRYGVPYGMILSTCNRTEVYTDVSAVSDVLDIWAGLTGEKVHTESSLFMRTGRRALEHLYKVMSGADSQIPGDMQITAQVKAAFTGALEARMSTGLFERIINSAVHCSRKVKTETDLVSGASSVPSAVVLAIKERFGLPVEEGIAVIGLGKMGSLSCQNILKITDSEVVTVINRTDSRAYQFARQSGTRHMPFSAMPEAVRQAGIVIVSTASDKPVLLGKHLNDGKPRLVFDLSVPYNVDPSVAALPNIQLVNLDHLAAVAKRHIQYRFDQLDDVERIIDHEVARTFDWWHRRRRYISLHTKDNNQRALAV